VRVRSRFRGSKKPTEDAAAPSAAAPPTDTDDRPPVLDLLLRPSPRRIRTRYDVAPDYRFTTYADQQSLFMDQQTYALIPNTEVWQGETLLMRINSLGCKGDDLDPGKPVVAFFGDSTTMGVGMDSWPAHVELPGLAVLNAGIEGAEMARVAERFEALRDRVELRCAVVYVGWHNLIYNDCGESYWESQLARFCGDHATVFCTIATSLHRDVRVRGFEPLRNENEAASADVDYYTFWANLEPASTLAPLLDGIDRFNAFLPGFAERAGAFVLDLASFVAPARYEDSPRDFFDACHLRVPAYPKVGAFATDRLAEILAVRAPTLGGGPPSG
jgi:hypothetical protein